LKVLSKKNFIECILKNLFYKFRKKESGQTPIKNNEPLSLSISNSNPSCILIFVLFSLRILILIFLTVENFKFEETRRKIFSDLKDVSYYVKDKLKNKNEENDLKLILENFDHRMK
jgi:hypothetical protein